MTVETRVVGRDRQALARRVFEDLVDGWCVNVGIGMPLLLPGMSAPGVEVMFHSEHGLVGVGRAAGVHDIDPDVTDAGKGHVTLANGAAAFDSSMSFAIARSGRLDLTVLGGLQVGENGDLANWVVPGGDPGVGGAMDLAAGAQRVWVMMTLADKRGRPKLLPQCTFPLTGRQVVDRLYTDLAIFHVIDGELVLRELSPGVTLEDLDRATTASFRKDL